MRAARIIYRHLAAILTADLMQFFPAGHGPISADCGMEASKSFGNFRRRILDGSAGTPPGVTRRALCGRPARA
jgi:hypothetical protein